MKFYWDRSGKKPKDLFWLPGKGWFWTGHGIMVKDKLLVFLMKEYRTKKGLGFEAKGWYAVLISNPDDDPSQWKMKYMEGPDTYGLIVGSAAVLKDEQFIYAFGAVEPATHEVYVLRWPVEKFIEKISAVRSGGLMDSGFKERQDYLYLLLSLPGRRNFRFTTTLR